MDDPVGIHSRTVLHFYSGFSDDLQLWHLLMGIITFSNQHGGWALGQIHISSGYPFFDTLIIHQ